MRCKFTERDLSQRLDHTICRYDGVPYYVRYVNRGVLSLHSLLSGSKKKVIDIHPNDEKFDVSTVPLGFAQASDSVVVYLSRRPNRLYKQGISIDSLSMKFIGPARANFNYISEAFENMVLNKYPSLGEAFNTLRRSNEDKEIAISRDTALKWNPNLKLIFVYFKGTLPEDEVGWVIPDTNIIVIPSSEKAWIVSTQLRGFSWEIR